MFVLSKGGFKGGKKSNFLTKYLLVGGAFIFLSPWVFWEREILGGNPGAYGLFFSKGFFFKKKTCRLFFFPFLPLFGGDIKKFRRG